MSITSWNIVCLRETPEPAFCNSDRFGDNYVRSAEQVEALRQHAQAIGTDILFLQEIENLAAVQGLLPGWEVTTVGTAGQNQAVAVSPDSKASVRGVSVFLDLGLSSDTLRPGLAAVIDYAGASVHVLAVHLKSGCQRDQLESNDSDCRTLRQQLDVVVDWVDARESRGQPYLLVGDFNRQLENDDPFMLALSQAASQPLYRTTVGARPTCWDHLQGAPSYRTFIDHHIASASVVAAWGLPTLEIYNYTEEYPDAWEYVSDHCPITATFD